MPSAITSRHGQPRNPVTAAAAPAQPAQRYPTITVTLRTLGPGRSWPSAKRSTNSCSVSQRRRSTSTRRAQNTMPPKPDRVIWEKVRNRAHAVTWGPCAAGTPLDSGDVDIMFPPLRYIPGQQYGGTARAPGISSTAGGTHTAEHQRALPALRASRVGAWPVVHQTFSVTVTQSGTLRVFFCYLENKSVRRWRSTLPVESLGSSLTK